MLARNVLYYGKDEPLPERIPLRAGPLSMLYENGDLRYIRRGSHEVLRRIYVAVRDRNWGTVPPVLSGVQMDIGEDAFRITYSVENRQGDIDFAWTATITGDAGGNVSFTMDGEARATFLKNRIGFCVLHPASCAGAPCRVEHAGGARENAELPYFISAKQPVPPFFDMRLLAHQVTPGTWAEVAFEGDWFEMEDQRNWTDASYKTFSTPLNLPYPVEIQKGTRITQSIRLSLITDGQGELAALASPAGQSQEIAVLPDPGRAAVLLPPIGLGVASHGWPPSETEVNRLKALHLHHLRVDLDLRQPDFPKKLAQASAQARALGVELEAGLIIRPGSPAELRQLAEIVEQAQPPVTCWLVYPEKEIFTGGSLVAEALEMARKALEGRLPGAEFAAGTNADFIFLQRSPPPLDRIDELALAICPQVHAFDNTSLVETLEAQPQVIATARKLAGSLPVRVSPVTLKLRFNPYATGSDPALRPGELPPAVDARQMSLFGAGWALGSLSALVGSGVSSLTFFETTGWRGVMETQAGSPVPRAFQSIPGGVFPVYVVFALLGEFAGGEIHPLKRSDPLAASGTLLRRGARQRILLANHTEVPRQIRLPHLPGAASFRQMDETNAEYAMRSPEEFLAQPGQLLDGQVSVTLQPYAIGWVDF